MTPTTQMTSAPETVLLITNRSGVWNVKINGRFYGDYLRQEWAIEAAFEKRQRPGSLAGDKDSIKWEMVRWILIVQPTLRERNLGRVRAAGRPLVEIASMRELRRLYEAWEVER